MEKAIRYNAFLRKLIEEQIEPLTTGGRRPLVVDFGAGHGQFAVPIQKMMGWRGQVVAVEKDKALRQALAAQNLVAYPSIEDLSDGSVSLVYSLNVLEHIEDDIALLRQIAQKVRPGGRLLIYVPAFPCLYSDMDKLVGHYRRYRREDLVGKVIGAGFQVHDARYIDSLGFPAALVYRMFSRSQGEITTGSVSAYDRFIFPLSLVLDKMLLHSVGKNLLVVASL